MTSCVSVGALPFWPIDPLTIFLGGAEVMIGAGLLEVSDLTYLEPLP